MQIARIFQWVLACALVGCAGGRTVTVSLLEPGSEMGLVALDNLDAAPTKVKNPTTLPISQLSKQALKMTAPGKAPVYWIAPSDVSRRNEIRVKALPMCSSVSETNRNRPLRLILKAYQALYSKDFKLCRELAMKASDVDPTLSAPQILIGLSHYQEGQVEEARIAFNKAKALDPEDVEIADLLRLVP